MIPEFIKKKQKQTLSDCRKLIIKINGSIQEKSQESVPLDNASVQTPEDNKQIHNFCDCCGILNEKMTRIESGYLLCSVCLEAFYETPQNAANPNR